MAFLFHFIIEKMESKPLRIANRPFVIWPVPAFPAWTFPPLPHPPTPHPRQSTHTVTPPLLCLSCFLWLKCLPPWLCWTDSSASFKTQPKNLHLSGFSQTCLLPLGKERSFLYSAETQHAVLCLTYSSNYILFYMITFVCICLPQYTYLALSLQDWQRLYNSHIEFSGQSRM